MSDNVDPATGQGTVLDGTVVLPEKRVVFSAEFLGDAGPPERFVLEEVTPPALGWLARNVAETNLGSFPATTMRRGARGARRALSSPQVLPPTGIRGRRVFRFYDARDREETTPSPELTIATLGNINVTTSLPTTGTPGFFSSDGTAPLKARIQWAKDPRFQVTILTPFGSPGENSELKQFVDQYMAERRLTLSEEAKAYFRQPPSGWSVKINATYQFELTINGQPVKGFFGAPGSIFELPFQINTPRQGKGLCAVKIVDLDNPQNVILSDVFGLEQK